MGKRGREAKERVKLMDLGKGRGQAVPLTREQIEKAGLDPDAKLEANRSVLGKDSQAIRARLYEQTEE